MLSSSLIGVRAAAIILALPFLLALSPPNRNEFRSAVSPLVTLKASETATLAGKTDGEVVKAEIKLSPDDAALASVSVTQDGRLMRLPSSALQGVKGARQAWLEERGALTTLVIEGVEGTQDWRLALEFHPEQLWLRRLSLRGHNRDAFTFYNRDDMQPSAVKMRRTMSRRLHD